MGVLDWQAESRNTKSARGTNLRTTEFVRLFIKKIAANHADSRVVGVIGGYYTRLLKVETGVESHRPLRVICADHCRDAPESGAVDVNVRVTPLRYVEYVNRVDAKR